MKYIAKASFIALTLINMASYSVTLYADEVDLADKRAQMYAPRTPKTVFNEEEAKKALEPGEVEIKSVLISCYGRGLFCKGDAEPIKSTRVFLWPYTTYAQELIDMQNKLAADTRMNPKYEKVVINMDDKYFKYMLVAKTDEYGRYSFKQLEPGKYYIVSDNVVGNRGVNVTTYDATGTGHTTVASDLANLGFSKIVEITQPTGVVKFDSKLDVVNYIDNR